MLLLAFHVSVIKNGEMSLEFPFTEVQDVELAFGGIPNYDSVLAACPSEFYTRNQFSEMAAKWFRGVLDPVTDMVGFEIREPDMEDAVMQRRYVETWIKSFRPSHEEKLAVTGWLLSLMLVEIEEKPSSVARFRPVRRPRC